MNFSAGLKLFDVILLALHACAFLLGLLLCSELLGCQPWGALSCAHAQCELSAEQAGRP